MTSAGWRDRVGPPSTLLGLALLLTALLPAALAAAPRPAGAETACPVSVGQAARAALRTPPARTGGARVAQQLSKRGELTGRVLTVPLSGGSALAVSLPPESFIADRVGDLMLYTSHSTAAGSEVRVIDVATGCDTLIARPTEIVRSAILDPGASVAYVHSVTRGARRDGGVQRSDLATGATTIVVPPLAPSERLGPVFATELRWSVYGDALTVQSCGFAQCLSRVLDIESGRLTTVDAADQGALIGTTDDHVVTFAACPGSPCAVIAFNRRSDATTILADEAYAASITSEADGAAVVSIETVDGTVEVTP